MSQVNLPGRSVLRVAGSDARDFLDRLVTNAVDRIAPGGAGYGALLTPQGKIIADFLCFASMNQTEPSFLLDVPSAAKGDFIKRLNLYKLRAKVTVEDLGDTCRVLAGWDGASMPGGPGTLAAAVDPRLADLGWRAIVERETGPESDADEAAYEAHRIGLGVPEGGRDFAFNDAFPHEALMDQVGGVDFDKGCYVGQEVVSRMQHRGTARTRIVPVLFEGHAPPPGTEVVAGERVLGRTGSVAGRQGLATVRLDRAADAIAAAESLTAGGTRIRLTKPDWISFAVPGDTPAETA